MPSPWGALLVGVHLEDALLDGPRRHEAQHGHGLRLPEPVHAVNCLPDCEHFDGSLYDTYSPKRFLKNRENLRSRLFRLFFRIYENMVMLHLAYILLNI